MKHSLPLIALSCLAFGFACGLYCGSEWKKEAMMKKTIKTQTSGVIIPKITPVGWKANHDDNGNICYKKGRFTLYVD
jgi:hypothetical protein